MRRQNKARPTANTQRSVDRDLDSMFVLDKAVSRTAIELILLRDIVMSL